MRAHATQAEYDSIESPYYSPNELVNRWKVSRSSVDRIARRAGIARIYLGEGRNGVVRYCREDVEAYEASRRVEPTRSS